MLKIHHFRGYVKKSAFRFTSKSILYFPGSLIFRPDDFCLQVLTRNVLRLGKSASKKSISSGREIPVCRKMNTEKRLRKGSLQMVSMIA